MGYIARALEPTIRAALLAARRKVVVLHGPRQAGKTTLVEHLCASLPGVVRTLNGDFVDDQALLRPERSALERLVAGIDVLVVDEAQNVPGIGRTLKLLHDELRSVRILATGSSSLDLARHSGEPLRGVSGSSCFTRLPTASRSRARRGARRSSTTVIETARGRARIPRLWEETYPNSSATVIAREDVDSFLLPP